jgi:predicted aldo/keto reductase-like oxidoreductase
MLSDDELKVYDRAIEAFNSYDTIPCTGCNYCTGCPQGVTIPYNFQTYNQYVLSGNMDRARWEWETTIPLNGARADACIACGTCEERCPQHIEISKELEKVAALFA